MLRVAGENVFVTKPWLRKKETSDARVARIRILSSELDKQRAIAGQRSQQIESKAGFVVLAAGLIVSGFLAAPALAVIGPVAGADTSVEGPEITPGCWCAEILALMPLLTSLAAVVLAIVAMWPRRFTVVSAENLVDLWVDASGSPEELEDFLLETKKTEIEARDERSRKQASALKWAFYLTAASIACVVVDAILGRISL